MFLRNIRYLAFSRMFRNVNSVKNLIPSVRHPFSTCTVLFPRMKEIIQETMENTPDLNQKFSEAKSQDLSLDKINVNQEVQSLHTSLTPTIRTNDDIFKTIINSQKSKKHRENNRKVILEGKNLIRTALQCGVDIRYIFYSSDDFLASLNVGHMSDVNVLKVKNKTFKMLCGNRPSPEVVAICSQPSIKEHKPSIPVTVLCSDVRDPNNLGSIISIAAATGCKNVLLTSGCVDVWEHKVLNSSDGAHFHIPIINNIKWPELSDYLPEDFAFYIADSGADLDLDDSQCYTNVNFGINAPTDDNTSIIDFLSSGRNSVNTKLDETQLQTYENFHVPSHLYCSIAFPKKDIVLYIGGETEGVNDKFEKLAFELRGQKIKIPLENGMDSLNVASALSIILFEMKRQLEKNVSVCHN